MNSDYTELFFIRNGRPARKRDLFIHVWPLFALAVGVWASTYRVSEQKGFLFLFALCVIAFLLWLATILLARPIFGFRPTIYRHAILLIPTTTSALCLLLMAGMRTYYSLTALLVFTLLATFLIALAAPLIAKRTPRPTAVVAGESPYWEELSRSQTLNVDSVLFPPEQLHSAIIIVPQETRTAGAWQQWLVDAELGGQIIVSDARAVEIVSRRIPLEAVGSDWGNLIKDRTKAYGNLKRAFDIIFTLLTAPVWVPLLSLVAVLVACASGWPILFTQERTGQQGRPFTIYKFRTMNTNSEKNGAQFAAQRDARVTRIGQFLRKYRLDELPQFYNVLRGEMSIIGPRPEQVAFTRIFSEELPAYELRHLVKPGITGWAQVTQGYAASAEETVSKLTYDLYYVRHQSAWLDFVIVVRTLITVLTGFGSR